MKNTLADYSLHGHVKRCVEQTTYPSDGSFAGSTSTTTYDYAPDGHLLQARTTQLSGPDYVTTYAYDSAGHLVKQTFGFDGQADTQQSSTFVYDDKGRITSTAYGSGTQTVRYEYGEQDGRKRRIEQLPTFETKPDTAVGGQQWENGDLHIFPASGGTVTTIYDEHDRPIEAQVRDANDQVAMRIVRKYDEKGRMTGDQLVAENAESMMPDLGAVGAELNDAQKKALTKFMTRTFLNGQSSYKYDSEGRAIEKHITGGMQGDEITSLRYNDHGDVTDEQKVRTFTPDQGGEFSLDDAGNVISVKQSKPHVLTDSDTHYAYEYDVEGNWTQKAMSVRSAAGAEYKPAMTIRRTLTYY